MAPTRSAETVSPPPAKAPPLGDTTERQVRRAAVALFASRGFHATGIRQLADCAGIKSATLYHYMATKEDLLFAIVQDSSRRLIEAAQRLADLALPPEAMVCGLVQMHVSVHATHRDETAVVDNELRHLDHDRRRRAVELRDAYEAFWTRAISVGARDGVFSVHNERLARLAILQMCSGVAEWYSPRGQLALPELGQAHAHMALQLLGHECKFAAVAEILASIGVAAMVAEVWSGDGADEPVNRSSGRRRTSH
jgi:AcrR family transcriptional regulator